MHTIGQSSNRLNSTVITDVDEYIVMSININWDEVIKKEARGLNDYDLGEVQEVHDNLVVTKKGVLDKDKFYLPTSLVERFDGHNLWFRITKEDAQTMRKD